MADLERGQLLLLRLSGLPEQLRKLVRISSQAIKAVEPQAKVILSGLFGKPTARGARGMPAPISSRSSPGSGDQDHFDGVALHPYAVDSEVLEELVEGVHEVTKKTMSTSASTSPRWAGDHRTLQPGAFDQGSQGQVASCGQPTAICLKISDVWISSRSTGSPGRRCRNQCNFCSSVGLFQAAGASTRSRHGELSSP